MKPRKDYGSPLRIYDAGPQQQLDRFTILPPRSAYSMEHMRERDGLWMAFASSDNPFHPQGFGQHCSAMAGPHLGQRITWADLPAAVQRAVRGSFLGEYCPVEV